MATNEELATKLVTDVLSYFQSFIKRYDWRDHTLYRIFIGSSGMGPEVYIIFRNMGRGSNEIIVEMEFWLHPKDDDKFVFSYGSLKAESEEIENESFDISNIEDVSMYFEKVATLLSLDDITSDDSQ